MRAHNLDKNSKQIISPLSQDAGNFLYHLKPTEEDTQIIAVPTDTTWRLTDVTMHGNNEAVTTSAT